VFLGAAVYTPGELGAETDADGEIVTITPMPVPTPKPTPITPTTKPTETTMQKGNGNEKHKPPSFPTDILKMVVAAKYAKDCSSAARRLGKSQLLTSKDALDVIVGWAELYDGYRQTGETSDDAARLADDELHDEIYPDVQEGHVPIDGEEAREMAGA
jgi:hypothetical protein